MTDQIRLLALFKDIDPAANAVETLEKLGIDREALEVVTGSPINPKMLGRHHVESRIPKYALWGAIFGGLIGIFLSQVTPKLYKIYVGGKPLAPGAPTVVVIFEMVMLFMLLSTFFGVFLESVYPSFEKKDYVPEISDGDIALIFECLPENQNKIEEALASLGAKSVRIAERLHP